MTPGFRLTVPLAALTLAFLLWIVAGPPKEKGASFLVILAFALLGLTTGVLAGFSREPVVGAVLPAVLSLVGGLAIYLIGSDRGNRVLISLSLIALSFDLFLGATWGAVLRDTTEEHKKSVEYRWQQALIEVEVRDFRRALGLPDYPP